MTTHITASRRPGAPHPHTASPCAVVARPDRDGEPVRLRDDRQVDIRHIDRPDQQGMLTFLYRLSPESRRTRFFSAGCDLEQAADWAASADQRTHVGILALDQAGTVVGHATCCRLDELRAEVAVEIDVTHRGQGLATILIARLAREAEHAGIRSLVAEVLPENHEMLSVLRDGFDAREIVTVDEVDVEFPTCAWRLLDERFHA